MPLKSLGKNQYVTIVVILTLSAIIPHLYAPSAPTILNYLFADSLYARHKLFKMIFTSEVLINLFAPDIALHLTSISCNYNQNFLLRFNFMNLMLLGNLDWNHCHDQAASKKVSYALWFLIFYSARRQQSRVISPTNSIGNDIRDFFKSQRCFLPRNYVWYQAKN